MRLRSILIHMLVIFLIGTGLPPANQVAHAARVEVARAVDAVHAAAAAPAFTLRSNMRIAAPPQLAAFPGACTPREATGATPTPNNRVLLPLIMQGGANVAARALPVDQPAIARPAIPLDPTLFATPLDEGTSFAESIAFLYSGPNAVQTGVETGAIDPEQAAVLRGTVLAQDGQPLSGVKIQIFGHTAYGQTLSRADGHFDLVVNAGQVMVCFELPGHLPTQRLVQAAWHDFTTLDNVVLLPMDDVVSTIDLTNSSAIQVAQNRPTSDGDGARQSALLFAAGAGAQMVMADGSTQPLTTLNVRATEYTVGETGPQAMPGELPPASGYTYAVEFTVDEALTAGAVDVQFDKPIINYVENFLDFPVGTAVPTGYYDRGRGAWAPSHNGRVIRIVAINGGVAALDVDGSGQAASAQQLAELGIDAAEQRTMSELYRAGQSLWRVPIPHFTPWDHNWPYGPPDDATPPHPAPPQSDTPDGDSCEQNGSIIECQNQTVGERIAVAGTAFSLNYRSSRVPAREMGRSVTIPVTGSSLPASLAGVILETEIAGQITRQTFAPQPNQAVEFRWDGNDAYRRSVANARLLTVRIGYQYPAVYRAPGASFQNSFGRFGGAQFSRNQARQELTIWRTWQTRLQPATWDARTQALGGWTLDQHHFYDTFSNTLHRGDGGIELSILRGNALQTVAGVPPDTLGDQLEDGKLATDVQIGPPVDIAVHANGTIYFANTFCVYKIDRRGIIAKAIRTSTTGCTLPTDQPNRFKFVNPVGLSLAPNGDLYVANHGHNGVGGEILRVRPNGATTSVAGNGERAYTGDGGPATAAAFNGPIDVAVAPDGSFYVADFYNQVVRHVGLDGIITTVAGGGAPADGLGDGGLATDAKLGSVRVITVDQDGALYIGHDSLAGHGIRVRRVGLDGTITTVVGGGAQLAQEGELGVETLLSTTLYSLSIGPDNHLYLNDRFRIRMLGQDGRMKTVAGADIFGYSADGTPLLDAKLAYATTVFAPDGTIYLAELNNSMIRKASINRNLTSNEEALVHSHQFAEIYVFNQLGQHLRTINRLTGATRYTFGYDGAGRLLSVTDGYGNVTRFERDGAGAPTAIVAPHGQRTTLAQGEDGFLRRVTDPDGQSYTMTYHDAAPAAGGLLATFTDRSGQVTTMAYDAKGRLISDSHALRGAITLTSSTTHEGQAVAFVSAAGRDTTYALDATGVATRRRTTFADGTQTQTVQQVDGSRLTILADGTEIFTNEGINVPPIGPTVEPVTVRITTPSGRRQETTIKRQTALREPLDPLSMTAITATVTTNGRSATTVHDLVNNQVWITTPAGRTSSYQRNAAGDITQLQLPGLHPETRTYDALGRLSTVTQGTGGDARTTTYAYNDQGLVSSITDGLHRTWAMTYDAHGRITALTLPDGSVGRYGYDASGRRNSVTPPDRQAHTFSYSFAATADSYRPPAVDAADPTSRYTYDGDGLLTKAVDADGVTTDYVYDAVGRLITMQTPDGAIARTYDSTTGMLTEIQTPVTTLSFTYDGRLTTAAGWAGAVAGQISYQYDNNLRQQAIQINGRTTIPLRYDADDLVIQAGQMTVARSPENGFVIGSTLGNTRDTRTYNGFGEVATYTAQFNASPLFTAGYSYDAVGRITQQSERAGDVATTYVYGYDLAGRLAHVTQNGSTIATYGYDANGNRTTLTTPGSTISATYDAQDRLLQYGNVSFTYTANGDLRTRTENGATTTYRYDALGNLASVALPDGRTIRYLSDGLQRRVGKQIDGALVQGFLYLDELHPIAELDGENNVVSIFVYGSAAGTPSYMIRQNVVYRIISDQVGSPRLVVNAGTGEVLQRMSYDAFGNVLEDTTPGFQPFGFAGGLYDSDSGLVRFGARDYDAQVGRWTSKDPTLFEAGSLNLYTYVNNDPVNFTDPTGEALPLLAALGIAWVVAETAMTASDILDFFDKLFDPCVNTGDKALAGILALLGIVGPGGGYGKLKKFFDKFADLFKSADKADTVKKLSKLDDAYEQLLKSMDIDPKAVRTAKGPPGTKPSPRNDVGELWDKH
ncbi:MAG: RHS repeat-associated core domain-containing protein [Caldilineaceae bacterium]